MEITVYDLQRQNICPKYFARCVILMYQDLEPEKVSQYHPINLRVQELYHGENELLVRDLETPRNIPYYFEPTCRDCIDSYKNSKINYHYSHEKNNTSLAHVNAIKNGINDDMKTFAITQHPLDKNFSCGMFGNFKIDLMNVNGYVRAASIRENDSSLGPEEKKLIKWLKTNSTQELILALEENLNTTPGSLVLKIKDANVSLRGVYLHPDLVIDFASWISPKFKILTQRIVKEHFRTESQMIIEQLAGENLTLTQRIISLEQKIDIGNNLNRGLNGKVDSLTKKINTLNKKIDRISVRASLYFRERGTHKVTTPHHEFVFMFKTHDEHFPHYFILCQRKSFQSCLSNMQQTFPDADTTPLLKLETANAKTTMRALFEKISHKRFKNTGGFRFDLRENELLKRIRDICDADLVIDGTDEVLN